MRDFCFDLDCDFVNGDEVECTFRSFGLLPLLASDACQPYARWSDVKTQAASRVLHNATSNSPTTGSMAQAAKKKLVVCGGNGFLGNFAPYNPSLTLFQASTSSQISRKSHM